MTDDKCTFGTRAPIHIHMLNEIIHREVKHFRNYKNYRPNFGSVPVTGKFYAAHDTSDSKETQEEKEKVADYHHKVTMTRAEGPASKYKAPATENQVYGWYHKPIYYVDRNDRRFNFPRQESEQTKIELTINPNTKSSRKAA